MGGPAVDKSAPSPSTFFLWNSFDPEFPSVFGDNTNNQRKTKDEGEKQPTELFAWLVILPQTHGHNDYCLRPLDLPKQQDVGPF